MQETQRENEPEGEEEEGRRDSGPHSFCLLT